MKIGILCYKMIDSGGWQVLNSHKSTTKEEFAIKFMSVISPDYWNYRERDLDLKRFTKATQESLIKKYKQATGFHGCLVYKITM